MTGNLDATDNIQSTRHLDGGNASDLPLGGQDLRPRIRGSISCSENNGGPGTLAARYANDITRPQCHEGIFGIRLSGHLGSTSGRLFRLRKILANPGVFGEIPEVAGHRCPVAILSLSQTLGLSTEAHDGLICLKLRETCFQHIARALAPHGAHQIYGHVVRRTK